MGQRLVIQLKKNNEVQSNCYYHWEGFLDQALPLVLQTLEAITRLTNPNLSKAEKIEPYARFLKALKRKDGGDFDPQIFIDDDEIKFDVVEDFKPWIYFIAHLSTGATIREYVAKDEMGFLCTGEYEHFERIFIKADDVLWYWEYQDEAGDWHMLDRRCSKDGLNMLEFRELATATPIYALGFKLPREKDEK